MPVLALTLEQWWWVQGLVRQTDRQGAVWDREDMGRVHQAILSLDGAYPDKTAPLEVSTGFLWQIENQVPQSLDVGRSNLGRKILTAVFRALHEAETEVRDEIPAVFRDLDPGAGVADADGDAGAKA